MEYGEKITALRKARGMTQADLGKALNVTYQAVSNWERGEAVPDFETLSKISKIFGVSITYFENDSAAPPAETPPPPAPAADAATLPEMLGVCKICGKVVYKGDEAHTSPALICKECVQRQKEETEAAKQRAAKKAKQKKQLEKAEAIRIRNKGLIVSGSISGVSLILSIIGFFVVTDIPIWENIGYTALGLVFMFTFIAQLFWRGAVVDVISFGVRAFSAIFSWGGLIALILLGLIIIPLLGGVFVICFIIAFLISPFTFTPAIIRLCRAGKS